MEIRCQHKKFGEALKATGELRIFCNSKQCKLYGDEVVEHIFNLEKFDEDQVIRPQFTNRYKRPVARGI